MGGNLQGRAGLTALHSPPRPQYGIVLDAGSSHTSMFVYKWPADKENGTGIVSQHSSCHVPGEAPHLMPLSLVTHSWWDQAGLRALVPSREGAPGSPPSGVGR